MITGEQVRAARKLLGWACLDVGVRVGVSETTIAVFEKQKRATPILDLVALRNALERAGVEFPHGEAPRVRAASIPLGKFNASNQFKAARKLLGWTQERLAAEAGVRKSTVNAFEHGARCSSDRVSIAIHNALERAGIEFPDGGPARLKANCVQRRQVQGE
jgi:DNA-binding XRE family transcriptional regulator